ncbi:MAG: AI-2E family transporter [Phycisphaeraceae bacterium]
MSKPPESSEANDRPVWHERWFQRLLVVLLVAAVAVLVVPAVLAVIYTVRPVLLPVLIALVLAYIANPLATWAQRRLRLPRFVSTVLLLLAVLVVILGLTAYLVPKVVLQVQDLIQSVPEYVENVAERSQYLQDLAAEYDIETADLAQTMRDAAQAWLVGAIGEDGSLDVTGIAQKIVAVLGVGLGVIGSTIGYVTYIAVAVVVVSFCFFFFLWKWPAMVGWFVPFIPAQRRERALEILGKMDASVSGFIRGRLIQASVVALVLSSGWWITGVPYFLLLGIGGGLLNLIPYAAVVAWPLAIGLAWLDVLGADGFSFWWVVFWPSMVYFLAQGLDGWVVEPLVQGKATNLDPLTVLLAVLLGGSIAGLLGLLIAIPTAACVKIFAQEVVLPKLRRWAAQGGDAGA